MNNLKLLLLSMVLVSFSHSSFADQCSWNNKKVITKAMSLLKKSQEVAYLCEPCGEKKAHFEVLESVSKYEVQRGQYQLIINGLDQDLAYTYFKDNNGNFVNLGIYSGCNPSGVSIALPKVKN